MSLETDLLQFHNDDKVILDLCAGTGSWSQPYTDNGYNVIHLTMPENDVRLFKNPGFKVHGVLAAPPCTCFASSGAHVKRTTAEMIQALSVVDACLRIVRVVQPVWWALENPIGTLQNWIGPPVFRFQPCDFGDPYTKQTLLWGNFNVPFYKPVPPDEGSKITSNIRSQTNRSITPPGFAQAFYEANP